MQPQQHNFQQLGNPLPSINMSTPKSLRLGDTAPDFTALSTNGPLNLHRYIGGSWVLFFSHPADFTPVCTTELGSMAVRINEFQSRNVKLLGISIGNLDEHVNWIKDMKTIYSIEDDFPFPIVADDIGMVASLYGMIDSPTHDPTNIRRYSLIHIPLTVRSVFIIDPNKRIRAIWSYPAAIGRNIDEIIRVLDSLQLVDQSKVVTPVNWKPQDEVIIRPDVTDEEANTMFPNFRKITQYLRLTKLE